MSAAPRLSLALLAACPSLTVARPGDLRPGPASTVERPGDVLAVSPAPDGTVTLAGLFSRIDSQPVPGLAKLKSDGRLDTTYTPGIGISPPPPTPVTGGAVSITLPCPVFQPLPGEGGGVMIGDPPMLGAGLPAAALRVPLWFVLDPVGQPVSGTFTTIQPEQPVLPQYVEDGKLIAIVSTPDPLTGWPVKRVRRITLSTGADDPSFSAPATGTPLQVVPAPNGGLWLLETPPQSASPRLKLLKPDGTESSAFTPRLIPGTSALLQSMPAQGLAVSSSQFEMDLMTGEGGWNHLLQFFNGDGSTGPERAQTGGTPPFFIEPNGALLLEEGTTVSASVTTLPAFRPRTLWRELPNGTRDPQFQSVHTNRLLHRLTDGRFLADGSQRSLPNGSPDVTWQAPVVRDHGFVHSLHTAPGGRIIGTGDFSHVDGQPRPGLARWNADGSLDNTFVPASAPGAVRDCAVAADGSLTVLRSDDSGSRLQRLHPDGSVNTAFTLTQDSGSSLPLEGWEEIEPLPGGSVLALLRTPNLGWQSVSQVFVIRISPSGHCTSLRSAISGSGLYALTDGSFFHNGRRWLANGAQDTTFTPPGGIASVPLCSLGAGSWVFLRTVSGANTPVLLQSSGTLDESFQAGLARPLVATGGPSRSLIMAQEGTITRLQSDGHLDPAFHPIALERRNESIPDGLPLLSTLKNGGPAEIYSLLVHPDTGDLWVAGEFTRVGTTLRSGIARLDAAYPSGFAAWSDAVFRGAPGGAADADPDGDGASNWREYAAGSDPLLSDSPGVSVQILTTQPLSVSAPLNPAATEIYQSLEISSDLGTWRAATSAEAVRKNVSGRPAFELAPAAGPRFVRIRYRTLP